MIIKKLRLQKCWSQEQLAEFSGLSVRTIQRIERGHPASLESVKALAAVFQLNIHDLQQESQVDTKTKINQPLNQSDTVNKVQCNIEEHKAMEYVEGIKSFYHHLFTYLFIISGLSAINLFFSPHFLWVLFAAGGWGIGLISHGINTFELFSLFSPEWEKKQVEKRLGRAL